MKGFVDIHTHILPGVDDGSKSMDETMKMIKKAYEEGIRSIVATPHYRRGRFGRPVTEWEDKLQAVKEGIKKSGIPIKILLGNEVYYFEEIVQKLNSKRIKTLGDTNYVLVEFSTMDDYRYIKDGLNRVLLGGYRPIIAHVERYQSIDGDMQKVKTLVEMGVYIQVNAGSVVNRFGMNRNRFVRKLIEENLVHLIASDTHDLKVRPPCLSKCADYLSRKHGKESAQTLLIENPKKILKNEYI